MLQSRAGVLWSCFWVRALHDFAGLAQPCALADGQVGCVPLLARACWDVSREPS